MTENAVENPVCSACGAPVRPHALFCYNCGSTVAAAAATAPQIEETEQQEQEKRDEISGESGAETQPLTAAAAADENFAAPIGKPTGTLVEDKPEKNSPSRTAAAAQAETKLKSAAALRRSGRVPPQKKVVEVVWEEPENAPNIWFLVVAFVLVLFAVGILLAMLYIR